MWAIMRKPMASMSSRLAALYVLLGDVGLGAVDCDAGHLHTQLADLAQVVGQSDPREQQAGDPRVLSDRAGLRDELQLRHLAEPKRKLEPPRPSPWAIFITWMPARSRWRTILTTFSTVYW